MSRWKRNKKKGQKKFLGFSSPLRVTEIRRHNFAIIVIRAFSFAAIQSVR